MTVYVCCVITPQGIAIAHVYTNKDRANDYVSAVTLMDHDRFYEEMEVENG